MSKAERVKGWWTWRKMRGRKWVLVLAALLLSALAPFAWHMNKLALATGDYQVEEAKTEMNWFAQHGGVLNRLSVLRDQALWLRLVQGGDQGAGQSLDQILAQYQDNRHRFWLFLWEIKQGDLGKAKRELDQISEPSQRALGAGILALAAGEVDKAKEALNTSGRGLSRSEEALWHLTWVELAMNLEDGEKADTELKAAEKLGSQNPAYLDMAYAHALWSRKWAEAKRISQVIDAQAWRPVNRYYLVTKALLAVQLEDFSEVQKVLGRLQGQSGSAMYVDYIQGVFSLSQGDAAIGKARLEKALQSGLDGHFKEDATKALSQLEERLAADKSLRVLD